MVEMDLLYTGAFCFLAQESRVHERLVCGAHGGAPATVAEAAHALWGAGAEKKVVFEAVFEGEVRDELDDVRVQVLFQGAADARGPACGGRLEVLPAGTLVVAEARVAGNDRKDEEGVVPLLDHGEKLPLGVRGRTCDRGLCGVRGGTDLPHAVPLALDPVAHGAERLFFGNLGFRIYMPFIFYF